MTSAWSDRNPTIKLCGYALFWIFITAFCGWVDSSVTVDINPDFLPDDENNPCELSAQIVFCWCSSYPSRPEVEEFVKCRFAESPSDKEWRAIAQFRGATVVEFINHRMGSIQKVPPSYVFDGMLKLHYFTMKMAAIYNIPSFAFGNSSNVSDIDLQDNGINELSENAFANLINVTVISLGENNLTEVNRNVFVNLPKLKELVLTKNGIQVVHDQAFVELASLEELSLQHNSLTVIAKEVFSGLQRLKHLELQQNMIEYIGDHVFAEMPRLQDLDLSANSISKISPTAFAGLRQLTRLNLKDNRIVQLHPETFSHLSKIHFLDLRNNDLRSFSRGAMKPIYKNLKSMNMQFLVEGNRFLCGCGILWIRELYEETKSQYVKSHFVNMTCDMFENTHRQVPSSSSSPTFFHTDGAPSDLSMLTSAPEETTTYDFDSVRRILNLTVKDLNCREDDLDGLDKHHDAEHIQQHPDTSINYHHHQAGGPKFVGGETSESYRPKAVSPPQWSTNGESHQRDAQVGMSSDGIEGHNRDSNLHEPQATAALEGVNYGETLPKSTASADHKVDTSRSSSIRTGVLSSASSKFHYCDWVLRVSLLVGMSITLILK